ncbi:hypothetical protein THAOC_01110 [Thalassiosira oceanica]|uniref:Pyridoxamine 5'-phosphate oxidase Alr4036 family FMN-binding domain-containing protein n=1 Tax=Thalassiosira oceanica TaxID=159749 RepID=K0TJ08_THAOC|nr:hypothetical protein THAOC_01110 [Thalassiosira oceanica]|eukprot:EJK77074.1 hypothetical protein THAOC_01110 [Thalassiosira oceanica]
MSLLVLGRIASKPSPFTNTIPTAFASSHPHPNKQGHCVSRVSRCSHCAVRTSTARAMSSSEGLSEIGDPNAGNLGADTDADLPSWKERIDASIARSRKVRGSNYVQISTVDRERMEPRCRTVVFRGFLRSVPDRAVDGVMGRVGSSDGDAPSGDYGDCVMKMITDRRSNKVTELSQFHRMASDDDLRGNDTAEMVWWFPKSSEQYRIRGRLQFVGGEGPLHSLDDKDGADGETSRYLVSERKQQWGNLSDPAREQFYWENPGVPYTLASENGVPAGGRDEEGRVLPAPDTFLLMLLYPTKIDYLRLGDNFRQVDEWSDYGPSSVRSRWRSIRVNP